jgi:8-oxo-dGTP pyrophosphatase MutT (NUDIX family)
MKPFERIGSREIYRNPYLRIEAHDVVHPSGVPGEHALIVTPHCSAVVVADGGDLLFTRQPRFGAQAEILEIVKGGAEAEETALECAQRETREELGIIAVHWEPLGVLYEIPSLMDAAVELFLAHGIEHVDDVPDAVESIELVRVPEEAAIRAAASGQINDAVTAAALLRYGVLRRILRFPDAV